MKHIDIVLPVYNEEQGLLLFDQALRKVTDQLADKYEFRMIYVVDKCQDRSYDVVKEICANNASTIGIQLSKRFGHQNSLMAGLSVCEGDGVIMMDSDMEHPPSVIPCLLEKFEEGYEIVYTEREYNEKVSMLKKMSSRGFYKIMNAFSEVEIKPSAADFRLISQKVLKVMNEEIHEQSPFLRGIFPWLGFRSTSVKYTSGERIAGKSKYSFARMVRFGLDGITSFSTKPLLISVYMGAILAFVTLLYMAYIIISFFVGAATPPGWVTTVVVIGFMGSLQLIVLGILGLYVGKLFEQAKGRPVFIVENMVSSNDA